MIGFGDALKRFREERGLSLRELDKLSGVNYAYIQRLESNDKTAPSDDKLDDLSAALKLTPQRRGLLKSLLSSPPVHDALFEAMLHHPVATVDAFVIAARVSFRGARPTSPQDWIKKLDEIDIEILGNRDH
jgi:HTH-type transcriptional regulator, competence development regulator